MLESDVVESDKGLTGSLLLLLQELQLQSSAQSGQAQLRPESRSRAELVADQLVGKATSEILMYAPLTLSSQSCVLACMSGSGHHTALLRYAHVLCNIYATHVDDDDVEKGLLHAFGSACMLSDEPM